MRDSRPSVFRVIMSGRVGRRSGRRSATRERLTIRPHPMPEGRCRVMRVTSEPARAARDDEDAELAKRLAHGNHAAFEALMRRHNRRLFRVARAILRDDSEAEDALQEAYLDAYRHIADFRGDARVSTWLTRIVVNRALMRMRSLERDRVLVPFHRGDDAGRRRARHRAGGRARRVGAGRGDPRRASPHGRAAARRAAGGVPHGVRHARHRGDVGPGDGRVPRPFQPRPSARASSVPAR